MTTVERQATYFAEGSPRTVIDERRAGELIQQMLDVAGPLHRILIIPPDYTRFHSWAGVVTSLLYAQLRERGAAITLLPALGTHEPMPASKREHMFPNIPFDAFRDHRWRQDLTRLGVVPGEFVAQVSGGAVSYDIPIEINRMLLDEPWDQIFSIGQLVPHEVIGIANHVKNVLVGVGGKETIHKSHYLGAVYGMERIMGQIQTPVRAVLQEGIERFGSRLPITYLLTVRGEDQGRRVTRGFYAGKGTECYTLGAELSQQVNIEVLSEAPRKVVVWLDPEEYHSTWLGNKAIYRTRMAIADQGELIVLAPGVRTFGEDAEIDAHIRRFGYRGTPATVAAVEENADLAGNLAAAAHLIHGSSEGRFSITYSPGHLSKHEIEQVGFNYLDPSSARQLFDPDKLVDGWNKVGDEDVYFIRHPGQGLWMGPGTIR